MRCGLSRIGPVAVPSSTQAFPAGISPPSASAGSASSCSAPWPQLRSAASASTTQAPGVGSAIGRSGMSGRAALCVARHAHRTGPGQSFATSRGRAGLPVMGTAACDCFVSSEVEVATSGSGNASTRRSIVLRLAGRASTSANRARWPGRPMPADRPEHARNISSQRGRHRMRGPPAAQLTDRAFAAD